MNCAIIEKGLDNCHGTIFSSIRRISIIPTGPLERTITYQAPFTKRNREQDYAMVWAVLDELKND